MRKSFLLLAALACGGCDDLQEQMQRAEHCRALLATAKTPQDTVNVMAAYPSPFEASRPHHSCYDFLKAAHTRAGASR